MLSNRAFFGNAGLSVWLANVATGSALSAWHGWARTQVAAGMPKTAAVPAGYGGNSLAMPQEAGAFACYNGARFAVDAAGDIAGSYVQAATVEFTEAATGSAVGLGVIDATAGFEVDFDADLQAEAPMVVTAGFSLDMTVAMDATAPMEALAGFSVGFTADLQAEAPLVAVCGYSVGFDASPAGAMSVDISGGFSVVATWVNPVGLGVWEASTEGAGDGGLTPASIAAATVAALQSTTIPVNVQQVRGQSLEGTGVDGDPWGPA